MNPSLVTHLPPKPNAYPQNDWQVKPWKRNWLTLCKGCLVYVDPQEDCVIWLNMPKTQLQIVNINAQIKRLQSVLVVRQLFTFLSPGEENSILCPSVNFFALICWKIVWIPYLLQSTWKYSCRFAWLLHNYFPQCVFTEANFAYFSFSF